MRTNDADDAGYWAASCAGDGKAFGVLFDRHRDRVFRHAYRLMEHRHDAQDVAATAFLEQWRRRDAGRLVNDSVLPWLLLTTTNVALNHRRARTRYRALLDGLPRTRDGPAALEQFLDRHPYQALEPSLAAALKALKPVDRGLITLVALEGYTLTSAATVLGISPGAAKTRLHRARRRIQDQIDPAPQETAAVMMLEGEHR